MVNEVAAQVVLVLILFHHASHLWVIRVLLEVGMGTWDGLLQVTQLGHKTSPSDVKEQSF